MYDFESEELGAEKAKRATDVLQTAFSTFMNRIADYILEHDEDIRHGGFALNEVLDRFGMQLMSFGTLFANLRSFAESEGGPVEPAEDSEEEPT